ncbi:MAG TPA: AI-2E family transporter, partial [Bacillota bacterium]
EWVAAASRALDNVGRWLQTQVLEGVPSLFALLVVTVIATFFISRDRAALKRFGLMLVPVGWRPGVERLFGQLFASFVGLANALTLLVLLTAAATTIGLTLLGSRYALLLGVTSGLLDIIPVIGPSLLFVPWIGYHLLFGDVVFGLLLLLLYGLVSGARTLLQAQIIGQQMGLHPLTTLFTLYVGAKLLGPIGFVAGPLAAVVIKAMYETGLLRWARD